MSQSLHTDNTQQYPELGYNTANVYSEVGWRRICSGRLRSVSFRNRASRQKENTKRKNTFTQVGSARVGTMRRLSLSQNTATLA